jgi:hypothetical protein
MENNFYKKIYNITLCNFWYRSYSCPKTQNIQKLDTEDIWYLRYCRSSFFTFLFFVQNLSETSSDKNHKSCGVYHTKSNKIEFAFF